MNENFTIGNWRTMKKLGGGGQGTVHLAAKLPSPLFIQRLREVSVNAITPRTPKIEGDFLDELLAFKNIEYGALKVLNSKEFDAKASERMQREIETLKN